MPQGDGQGGFVFQGSLRAFGLKHARRHSSHRRGFRHLEVVNVSKSGEGWAALSSEQSGERSAARAWWRAEIGEQSVVSSEQSVVGLW